MGGRVMGGSVLMCGRVMGGSVDYSLVGWLARQMSACSTESRNVSICVGIGREGCLLKIRYSYTFWGVLYTCHEYTAPSTCRMLQYSPR